jgi:regulator of ribonuclease activity A
MDGPQAVTAPSWATADLCDAHPDRVRVALPVLHDFGGVRVFHGPVSTLRSVEDYRPVLRTLEEGGLGRVLVVDGGGSTRRAILGERLLGTALRNGWAGVIVNGAIRDRAITADIPVGLRALGTVPCRGESGAAGVRDRPVEFAGIVFTPGDWLWADEDGLIVGDAALAQEPPA